MKKETPEERDKAMKDLFGNPPPKEKEMQMEFTYNWYPKPGKLFACSASFEGQRSITVFENAVGHLIIYGGSLHKEEGTFKFTMLELSPDTAEKLHEMLKEYFLEKGK